MPHLPLASPSLLLPYPSRLSAYPAPEHPTPPRALCGLLWPLLVGEGSFLWTGSECGSGEPDGSKGVEALRGALRGLSDRGYAGSWIWTSGNSPSTHSGE